MVYGIFFKRTKKEDSRILAEIPIDYQISISQYIKKGSFYIRKSQFYESP